MEDRTRRKVNVSKKTVAILAALASVAGIFAVMAVPSMMHGLSPPTALPTALQANASYHDEVGVAVGEPFFVEREPGAYISCRDVEPEDGFGGYTMCDHENTYTAEQVAVLEQEASQSTDREPEHGEWRDGTGADEGEQQQEQQQEQEQEQQLPAGEPEWLDEWGTDDGIGDMTPQEFQEQFEQHVQEQQGQQPVPVTEFELAESHAYQALYGPGTSTVDPKWQHSVGADTVRFVGTTAGECIPKAYEAFDLLNSADSPMPAAMVERYLQYIMCVEIVGNYPYEHAYAVPELYMFVVGPSVYNGSPSNFAAAMVHEACHNWQHNTGNVRTPYEDEMQCTIMQYEAMVAMGAPQWELAGVEGTLDNPEANWWD